MRRGLFVFAVSALLPLVSSYSKSNVYTFATGGLMGVYYPVGGAVCRLFNLADSPDKVKCAVHSTAGSVYNITSVAAGVDDFGIAQSDKLYNAYNNENVKNIRSVLSLYKESVSVVVKNTSNIKTINDFAGKVVNVGAKGSGNRQVADMILGEYGVKYASFKRVVDSDYPLAQQQFCKGDVDALIFVAGNPNWLIQELTEKCNASLISLDSQTIEKIIKKYPFYRQSTIPSGLYYGVNAPVQTIAVESVIFTSDATSDDAVFKLLKTIFNNLDSFKNSHSLLKSVSQQGISDDLVVPIHPGAKRFIETEIKANKK